MARRRFTGVQIEAALRAQCGNHSGAAQALENATGVRVTRQAIRERIKHSARLQQVIEETQEEVLDLAESSQTGLRARAASGETFSERAAGPPALVGDNTALICATLSRIATTGADLTGGARAQNLHSPRCAVVPHPAPPLIRTPPLLPEQPPGARPGAQQHPPMLPTAINPVSGAPVYGPGKPPLPEPLPPSDFEKNRIVPNGRSRLTGVKLFFRAGKKFRPAGGSEKEPRRWKRAPRESLSATISACRLTALG